MLSARQRPLLDLLHASGGAVANTDFQKLLFLYTHEWEEQPSHEFVPYHFGGFSFTSFADRRRLMECGLLVEHEAQWELAAAGRQAAEPGRDPGARTARFAAQTISLRGDALIATVYRRHP